MILVVGNISYIAPAAIYPLFASKNGVPEYCLGIVFASYSLCLGLYFPIIINLNEKYNPKYLIIIGCCLIFICSTLFGYFALIHDFTLSIIFCFLARSFEAFGYGLVNTAITRVFKLNQINNP